MAELWLIYFPENKRDPSRIANLWSFQISERKMTHFTDRERKHRLLYDPVLYSRPRTASFAILNLLFTYKELQSHAKSIVLHVAIRKKLVGPNNPSLWQNLLRDMRYKVYFDEIRIIWKNYIACICIEQII